jgi:general secretion pathway protein G
MIELLVVIGIIVLLATIALPALSRVLAQAKRTQMAADLQVISQALEAYRHDFGDYPRIRNDGSQLQPTGASLLCWALIAPGPAKDVPGADGADGPGFRVRGTTGAIKGPYLSTDRFTVASLPPPGMTSDISTGTPATTFDNVVDFICDRNYHPILYFPANKSASAQTGNNYISQTFDPNAPAVFTYGDTTSPRQPSGPRGLGVDSLPNKLTLQTMRFRMGDINMNGILDQNESPVATGPYLLWAPGPDGLYGNDGTHGSSCDDVVDNGASVQLNTAQLPANATP